MISKKDVALVIKKKDLPRLLTAITEYDKNKAVDRKMLILLTDAQKSEKDEYIVYYWNRIPWHPEYTDVQFIKNLMRQKYGIEYDLVTIGEKCNDIAEWYYLDSMLIYPMSSISINI